MSLFKPAENTMAKAKIGFMGEAGSGKTYTATLTAIGLLRYLKATGFEDCDKPAFFIDTEQGSSWIKPEFDKAGLKLEVAKTRAFKDLVPALNEAEQSGAILLIDSITHFWLDLQQSYMNVKKRSRLEFQDWAYLKKQWGGFTDRFVSSNLHIIMCGRLGFEYEQYEDDNGKRQIEKSGVKMAAEKGLGYEPNLLVWMERETDLSTKQVTRTAIVLKDRSQMLDGKQFQNPTFETFQPHFDFLAKATRHEAVDMDRTSEDIIDADDESTPPWERKSIQRQIVLDEIQALMVKHYPSTSAQDKAAKAKLLVDHFKTTSWTEAERVMALVDLQANFDSMHRALEKTASRYGVKDEPPAVHDEIPDFDAPTTETVIVPEPELAAAPPPEPEKIDDRDVLIGDFKRALAKTFNATRLNQIWKAFQDESFDILDEPRKLVAKAYHLEAKRRIEAIKHGTAQAAAAAVPA